MTQNGSAPDRSTRKRIPGLKAKAFIADEVNAFNSETELPVVWSENALSTINALESARSSALSEEHADKAIYGEMIAAIFQTASAIQERILEEAGVEGLTQEAYQRKLDEYIGKITWVW